MIIYDTDSDRDISQRRIQFLVVCCSFSFDNSNHVLCAQSACVPVWPVHTNPMKKHQAMTFRFTCFKISSHSQHRSTTDDVNDNDDNNNKTQKLWPSLSVRWYWSKWYLSAMNLFILSFIRLAIHYQNNYYLRCGCDCVTIWIRVSHNAFYVCVPFQSLCGNLDGANWHIVRIILHTFSWNFINAPQVVHFSQTHTHTHIHSYTFHHRMVVVVVHRRKQIQMNI